MIKEDFVNHMQGIEVQSTDQRIWRIDRSIRNHMQLLPVAQYSCSCKRFVVYHGGNLFLRIKISKKLQMFIEPQVIMQQLLSSKLCY